MVVGKSDIRIVKKQIDSYIGSKVRIRSHKSRKKIVVNEGVIESTYPSLFVVKLVDEDKNLSYTTSITYADVLTHTVELSLC